MRSHRAADVGDPSAEREAAGAPRPTRPSIVVPLDGSTHALVAVPVARTLARIEDSTLHVVHVTERALPPEEVLRTVGLTPSDLQGAVVVAATGRPADAIVRAARTWRSSFIVMCAQVGKRSPGLGLGRVAEEVVLTAPCPVVLVSSDRGVRPWALREVLFPHDGTPASAMAIGPASGLVQRADAALLVLHVATPGVEPSPERGTLRSPSYVDQPQHEWPLWAREFLERFACACSLAIGPKLRMFLVSGDPGDEIVRFAREHAVDLVMLAWSGTMEPDRALTLKKVVAAAPCPVLIARFERAP